MSMMPPGMAVPDHVMQQMLAKQMQGPTLEEQRRQGAIQLAIASFNSDASSEALTDETLASRTKCVVDLLAGTHEVFKGDTEDLTIDEDLLTPGPSGLITPT